MQNTSQRQISDDLYVIECLLREMAFDIAAGEFENEILTIGIATGTLQRKIKKSVNDTFLKLINEVEQL